MSATIEHVGSFCCRVVIVMTVLLKLGQLSGNNKEYLDTYKVSCKSEMDRIAVLLINVYPENSSEKGRQQAFQRNLQKESSWNLKGVSGRGNRLSSLTSIKLERAVPSAEVFKINFFDEMDNGLKNAKKFCENQLKILNKNPVVNEIQIESYNKKVKAILVGRAYNKFLQVQAQSVVAEVGSLHYLDKFKQRLEQAFSGNVDSQNYKTILNKIEDIKLLVGELSLNSLDNRGIENYSASDTMEIRNQISTLCNEVTDGIDSMNKSNVLQGKIPTVKKNDNGNFLKVVLKEAEYFFRIKNDINCQNPTVISSTTEKRIKLTNYIERVALVSSVVGIGATAGVLVIPVTTPVLGPVALVSGATALVSGLGAAVIKTSNSIANLAQHGVLPTKVDTIGVGLTLSCVLAGGLGNVGPILSASYSTLNVALTSVGTFQEINELKNSNFKERQKEMLSSQVVDNTNPPQSNAPSPAVNP